MSRPSLGTLMRSRRDVRVSGCGSPGSQMEPLRAATRREALPARRSAPMRSSVRTPSRMSPQAWRTGITIEKPSRQVATAAYSQGPVERTGTMDGLRSSTQYTRTQEQDLRDMPLHREIWLVADLMCAVATCEGNLSQAEIDAALGLAPSD